MTAPMIWKSIRSRRSIRGTPGGCPLSLTAMAGIILTALVGGQLLAEESGFSEVGKSVPRSRPEMKRALEGWKQAIPRLPLRPLKEEELAAQGNRLQVNNGLARALYLPATWQIRSFDPDPAMSLDYVFKTRIFWIVSRCNNCYYCLGHQEHKLIAAGLSDDQIAELDTNWAEFPPSERAAFALARKMTLQPYAVGDVDIDALRTFFNSAQIVELIYTIASYNSTNRWTDSLGLPQDQRMRDHDIKLDTPTTNRFQNTICEMLPAQFPKGARLESRQQVENQLANCRSRHPRVALPGLESVRLVSGMEDITAPVAHWMRALALFPTTAAKQIRVWKAIETDGHLAAPLKAKLFWVAARYNQAYYALYHAENWLTRLGESPNDLYEFPAVNSRMPAAERTALQFAAKLTFRPQAIVDEDIAELRKVYSDTEVAQIVNVVCVANQFDRFTEALALPLDEQPHSNGAR